MTTNVHTLVTFLGKGKSDPNTGYRKATYSFSEGTQITTPFFGLGLNEYLNPDRLVILGTSGSMWAVLVEHLPVIGKEDLRVRLIEAADQESVNQALLDEITPLVTSAISKPCLLRLIPYGRDANEQIDILTAISSTIFQGRVTLDLTHGFRHLAALGLLSGLFLERIAGLAITDLYYGALDMTKNDITPVVVLTGLLAIQHWINALDRYDQSGDYGVFMSVLIADGVSTDKAQCLEEAAFCERTFNLSDAARKLRTFLPILDAGLPGAGRLFQEKLAKRLEWARNGTLTDHQRRLANFYLRNGDYVRAAVFGCEALITQECVKQNLDPLDFQKGRGPTAEKLDNEVREGLRTTSWTKDYWTLKELRNSLAHGNPSQRTNIRKIITNRENLSKVLRGCFENLLNFN